MTRAIIHSLELDNRHITVKFRLFDIESDVFFASLAKVKGRPLCSFTYDGTRYEHLCNLEVSSTPITYTAIKDEYREAAAPLLRYGGAEFMPAEWLERITVDTEVDAEGEFAVAAEEWSTIKSLLDKYAEFNVV
jgi:hypothetical protein